MKRINYEKYYERLRNAEVHRHVLDAIKLLIENNSEFKNPLLHPWATEFLKDLRTIIRGNGYISPLIATKLKDEFWMLTTLDDFPSQRDELEKKFNSVFGRAIHVLKHYNIEPFEHIFTPVATRPSHNTNPSIDIFGYSTPRFGTSVF